VRELNKRNKEDWKNDKMARGLRFFADSSVRVPPIVTLRGHEHGLVGEAEDEAVPAHHT
jgi:hypothetical protein